MINNRQNGRRRGRGGQQPRNGQPSNPHSGSRVDNRQRGNAAQLFEKYKTLARDAQMQGDRVNTEYYLQFADHYFRVLSENRTRYEEQRRPRDEQGQEFGTEDEGADAPRSYAPRDFSDDGWDEAQQENEREQDAPYQQQPQQRPQQQPQRAASPEQQGGRRQPYPPRANGQGNGYRAGNGDGGSGNGGNYPAGGNGAPVGEVVSPAQGGGDAGNGPSPVASETTSDRIAIELPPALAAAPAPAPAPAPMDEPVLPLVSAEGEEQAPAPKRRRGRKPKTVDAPQPDA